MSEAVDMSGKAVIVTGGCKGIGRAIACRFLEAGAGVVVCARHEPGDVPRGGGERRSSSPPTCERSTRSTG